MWARPSLNQPCCGKLAARDGDEGGDARLGGQHVVGGDVSLLELHIVADGEKLPLLVDEKGEVHCLGLAEGLVGDGVDGFDEFASRRARAAGSRAAKILDERLLAGAASAAGELGIELRGECGGIFQRGEWILRKLREPERIRAAARARNR